VQIALAYKPTSAHYGAVGEKAGFMVNYLLFLTVTGIQEWRRRLRCPSSGKVGFLVIKYFHREIHRYQGT
jgi:hypothetical protein